jgi:beta-glucosidase-like glycosyl hydrolase
VTVVQAVNAGVDMLMITDNLERRVMESIVRAVARGQINPATIDRAYARILSLKQKYGIVRRTPAAPAVSSSNPPPAGTVPSNAPALSPSNGSNPPAASVTPGSSDSRQAASQYNPARF